MDNKKEISELLIRLNKVNRIYKVANEEQRGRLLDSCQETFKKLDVLTGMPLTFFETLVIGGKDFVESLDGGLLEMCGEYNVNVIFSN